MIGVNADVSAALMVGVVASLTVAPRAKYKSISDWDSAMDVSRFDASNATAVTELPNTSPHNGISLLTLKAEPPPNPADPAMNGGFARSNALPQPNIRLVKA
mmetsp:Transcript_26973/g.58953  ORF Transcript_26973/g.58953 Transcript_26973/m.58953 type:complete len:102 (-) Transcript_26973:591-896(-)